MNDPQRTPGADVPEHPSPVVYAPGAGELPAALAAGTEYTGPLVLLLNTGTESTWAADAAVGLASAWARAGRRVVLADLHLEEPVLHERTGESNLDGVVDIFLYGASVARSARPPRGQDFYLIPAGTYTASPEDVYAHPRWSKLIAGFREAGATLLVFAPANANGVGGLAERSEWAVFLGRPEPRPVYADRLDVRAVLVPSEADLAPPGVAEEAAARAAGESATSPLVGPDDDELAEEPQAHEVLTTEEDTGRSRVTGATDDEVAELDTEVGEAEPEAAGFDWDGEDAYEWRLEEEAEPLEGGRGLDETERTPAWPGFPEPAEEPLGAGAAGSSADTEEREIAVVLAGDDGDERDDTAEPTPPPMSVVARRRAKSGGPMIWLLIVGAILVLVALALALVRPDLFGRTGPAGARQELANATTTTRLAAAPVPAGDTLAYTVQVRAYISLASASTEADRQRRRMPETVFYVVPEQTQGVLYYKVLAGLLPDTAAATALRSRLVQAGVVLAADARDDTPGSWSLIQARPWAFDLGEFPDSVEAAARVDSLAVRDVPAYSVAYPYSDGTRRWRLYGGAYPDAGHADEMRRLLETARLPARLVTRIGRASTLLP